MFTPITAMYIAFFVLSLTVVTPQSNFRSLARRVVLAAAGSVRLWPALEASTEKEIATLPAPDFVLRPFAANAALAEFNLLFHAVPPCS